MTINRKLTISVEFSVTDTGQGSFGGSATYTQTGSTPDMGQIVKPDGTIEFDKAPDYDDQVYKQNIDIEFTLVTPCVGAHSFKVAWATVYGAGMTISPPENGTIGEMTVVTNPSNPNLISILDKDDDSNIYNYKPAVEIIRDGLPNYFIGLDPRIVNRPRTQV